MNKIRCVGRWVLAVSCMLAGGLTLEAETFPPAPGIATPPILSEAKLWLDAWDYDTFQFDENGFVTNWVDKSARKADASAYAASSASGASVLGVLGVTNGVPAYLMGAPGSGIDLQFSRISNIRSIFWVMDIVPGDATNARFLGDANSTTKDDFERTSGSIFH